MLNADKSGWTRDKFWEKNAKELKTRINDLSLKYGKLLFNNPDEAIQSFGATIIENGGAYLKQVFSVMKNKAYKFDAPIDEKGKFMNYKRLHKF